VIGSDRTGDDSLMKPSTQIGETTQLRGKSHLCKKVIFGADGWGLKPFMKDVQRSGCDGGGIGQSSSSATDSVARRLRQEVKNCEELCLLRLLKMNIKHMWV
jgi:hypothetical protein